MIAMLEGKVRFIGVTDVLITVSGVGYRVFTSSHNTLPPIGEDILVYTHLAVRETALDLYGFTTPEELGMFELLITLPKIGPKSALQIMTQSDIALLREAVAKNDPTYLSKMSGIGKKTAEKLVLGLKDKLDDFSAEDVSGARGPSGDDVVDALIALGYSPKDAREALKEIDPDAEAHVQIKEALKALSS